MKGLVLYYSNTGNTKSACEYIRKNLYSINLELKSFTEENPFSVADYNIIGFACFTDAWQPPKIFSDYIQSLSYLEGKYVFLFNTYGSISGKTIKILYWLLKDKGAKIIAAHSLHTPENYPPMIAAGHGFAKSPSIKEMCRFRAFIEKLDIAIDRVSRGTEFEECRPKIGLLNTLLPNSPTKFTRLVFHSGSNPVMRVDGTRCVGCGSCARGCPVEAISLTEDKAMIDNRVCQTCFSCYNHCPAAAITYGEYTGQGRYPGPPERYRTMLEQETP